MNRQRGGDEQNKGNLSLQETRVMTSWDRFTEKRLIGCNGIKVLCLFWSRPPCKFDALDSQLVQVVAGNAQSLEALANLFWSFRSAHVPLFASRFRVGPLQTSALSIASSLLCLTLPKKDECATRIWKIFFASNTTDQRLEKERGTCLVKMLRALTD